MEDLGLARGIVRLVPHRDSWHQTYTHESILIQKALRIAPFFIEHVGSTSIPGIMAKPILDIAIKVDSFNTIDSWINLLGAVGYSYKGIEPDMPQRRFFIKGTEASRVVYLHIVNNQEFKKMTSFRDTLIANQRLAKEYSDLKVKLASAHETDRKQYTHLKDGFIANVLNLYTS